MGGLILTSNLSIVVNDRMTHEEEKKLVAEMNSDFEALEKKYEALRLMMFGFDPDDL